MNSQNKPLASAILAVYNSETTIKATLDSLLLQSVPIEIIVIDDGSTDKSLKIINTDESIHRYIKVYKQNHAGPALARNLGSRHAKSDILLFVDSDMVFDRDYVKDLIAPIKDSESIGTYTTQEMVANWQSVWARCWNIEEGWEDKKRFPKNPPKYGTDFRAILKSEFDRVGGFDNIGYTDTWSLFHKLGVRPLATKAICYHKNPDSLSAVFRQARWAAKRPYKYGILGTFFALMRTSLPLSIIIGISKFYKEPFFVKFKIIYDLGRFVGIMEMLLTGKLTK